MKRNICDPEPLSGKNCGPADRPPQTAGFAVEDITPVRPAFLGGYAGRNRPSEGISDRLYIRAGAFQDRCGNLLVLVSIDLLELPKTVSETIYALAQARRGLRREQLILNVVHTHCGPILAAPVSARNLWTPDEEYVRTFIEKAVSAIGKALDDRKPAAVFFGFTELAFGISRRLKTEKGIEMRPDPDGFVNHSVPVLSVERENLPRVVFYSMNCHPTCRGGYLVSADFPGFAARYFEGPLVFLQGAAGSTKPRVMSPDGSGFVSASPEWMENAGRRIAQCLTDFLGSGKMREIELDLRSRVIPVSLKLDTRCVPERAVFEKMAEENPRSPYYQEMTAYFERQLDERSYAVECPLEIGCVRLAEKIRFLTVSGEITAEAANVMLDAVRRPGESVFLLGYCGYLAAYIPVDAMLKEKGYEVLESQYYYGSLLPFAPGIDECLASAAAEACRIPDPPAG